jgi:hypothetical protein
MRIVSTLKSSNRSQRRNERGAALITTLLISTLLLTAGGALILTTALATTNSYDSTAETQAYYAAEAGLQATLNVLRGNVAPALTYRDVVIPANSNIASDPATSAASPWARLSKWLTYDATFTDRVVLTTPYSSLTGSAYNVVLTDPDNSSQVTFTTTGVFDNGTPTKTFGVFPNTSTITFTPQTNVSLSAYPTAGTTSLGTFTVTATGLGAGMPANTRFTITLRQTAPWTSPTVDIVCTLSGNTLNLLASTVDVTFPVLGYNADGTLFTLGSLAHRLNPQTVNGGAKTIPVTITAPQPKRVLVRVNGYGPRGARKQMETMISRFVFSYTPRSLVALRSSDNGTQMTFDDGNSNPHSYSGYEPAGGTNTGIAAFAVTSPLDAGQFSSLHGSVMGNPATETVDLTDLSSWLQNADEARRTLDRLEASAYAQNRHFTTASPPASYGTDANPLFTFVNGDCNPGGGAGLVVCTGTVTFNGNDNFKGLILALGSGRLVRNGGGNGQTYGALAVAAFNRTAWGDGFLAPTYDTNGGGTSDMFFDPTWVQRALSTASRYPLGVSEY